MLRAIREIQPSWVVGENVRGLTNWNGGMVFDEVQSDLETQGYEVLPFLLPAAALNAPHRRDRIWFIAYSNSYGSNKRNSNNEINTSKGRINALNNIDKSISIGNATDSKQFRLEYSKKSGSFREGETETQRKGSSITKHFTSNGWTGFPTQSPICSGDDGVPRELDGISFSKWRKESIKAYGNAVVPQVAYQIFKSICQYQEL
jgi:DNA (cytosine-5)-methyltransferase 1